MINFCSINRKLEIVDHYFSAQIIYLRCKSSEKGAFIGRKNGDSISKCIPPDILERMALASQSWFDSSSNGKSSLLPDLESLNQIYGKINLTTCSNRHKVIFSREEEAMMRTFYHAKIKDICGALEYSLMVEYDAHVFLHKYFLKYGILDYDTKHVM